MNIRTVLIAIVLAALSSTALAELPVCDTQAQIFGNPEWIEMQDITVDELVNTPGLPCQASFKVDLSTAGDLFAYTHRDLSEFDDLVFQFDLALGSLSLSIDDVWTFLTLEFDDSSAVDVSVIRGSDNPGEFRLLVAYQADDRSLFKEISLPSSQSSHPMRLYWDEARGSLSITRRGVRESGRIWQSDVVISARVGAGLSDFLMGLIVPLDNPVHGSAMVFRPVTH